MDLAAHPPPDEEMGDDDDWLTQYERNDPVSALESQAARPVQPHDHEPDSGAHVSRFGQYDQTADPSRDNDEDDAAKDLASPKRASLLDAMIEQRLVYRGGHRSYLTSEHQDLLDNYALERINDELTQGDTLIIMSFPPNYKRCNGTTWKPTHFKMNSQKLLDTQSSVFADLLSPKRQARFMRRFAKLADQEQAQFVIDMTPNVEGEDAAAQLAELSLPEGAISWWQSKERLKVSQYLVSGHDDHCPNHDSVPADCEKVEAFKYMPPTAPVTTPRQDVNFRDYPVIDLDDIAPTSSRRLDDYCPIRHRATILRVLLAIEGHSLVVNSATRMFTLAGVAKILDCRESVQGGIFQWLLAHPNTDFLEILPETAIHVAWSMEIKDVARMAFRILVVEHAMAALACDPQLHDKSQVTVLGRPKADLPDEVQNVVQHAASNLADRVSSAMEFLESDDVYDKLEMDEWKVFLNIGRRIQALSESQRTLDLGYEDLFDRLHILYTTLKGALLAFFHDIVTIAMGDSILDSKKVEYADRNRKCYVPLSRLVRFPIVYKGLARRQRLLTRFPWDQMKHSIGRADILTFSQHLGGPVGDLTVSSLVRKLNKALDQLVEPSGFQGPSCQYFDEGRFLEQLTDKVFIMVDHWVYLDSLPVEDRLEVPVSRSSHLALGLDTHELKFLPLWAGGDDDGTGGVFEESFVPDTDMGAIGPGPAYHTEYSLPSAVSSISGSAATVTDSSDVTVSAGRSVVAVGSEATTSTFVSGTASSIARSFMFTPGASDVGEEQETSSVQMEQEFDEPEEDWEAFDVDEEQGADGIGEVDLPLRMKPVHI